ncbi:MAG: LysR family transcriptional regulator, partial [Christensenellales bacterium]
MNLKQLKYFLAIAQERQITAAAKKLHISQPPLSYQLSLLERELGVTLVTRGPRGIQLTGAGELLKDRAEQILELASSAAREVAYYEKGMFGTLSIGTISSSGGVVPGRLMLDFTKNYPNVRFEIHEGNSFEVIEMLEKRIVDIGIVRTPFKHDMIDCRYAPLEPMMAVMPENYVCGRQPERIELSELKAYPLIIYRRFEALLHEVFSEAGIAPFICCKNDDARTTLAWAHAGLGIGIVPQSALLMP